MWETIHVSRLTMEHYFLLKLHEKYDRNSFLVIKKGVALNYSIKDSPESFAVCNRVCRIHLFVYCDRRKVLGNTSDKCIPDPCVISRNFGINAEGFQKIES